MPSPLPLILPMVLIVARDPDMRESLAFLLRAEGYQVQADETVPEPFTTGPVSCVIIDEHVLSKESASNSWLSGLGQKLIVLSSRPGARGLPSARTVQKPLLQSSVLDMLHAALASSPT